MFSDPRFTALPIATARLIVPWDVQRAEPERLASWLRAAAATGVEPLLALGHARGDRCPASPCGLPSVADYRAALRAILDAHPDVTAITPWNEPNHVSQPTAGHPRRAAAYYDAARAACPRCTLVAGDVLDAHGFIGWLAEYRRALSETPAVWGLHNYYDTTYGTSDGLEGLLATVSGQVWLTETGGIVSHRTKDGRVNLPVDERRAAEGVRRAIELADARSQRVRRAYVYQWRARQGADFDAGLIAPLGEARPGYAALRRALESRSPAPTSKVQARRGAPHLVLTGRATLRGRRLSLPLACATYEAAQCAGQVAVESARWRTAPLVNGRPRARLIPPAARSVSIPATKGAKVTVRLARRPSRNADLRLRVSLAEADGESVVLASALRLR